MIWSPIVVCVKWVHMQSSLVGDGTVILGDFSHLLMGLFGSTDLIVDPYSSASSAIVKITTHTFADIAVR